MKDEDILQHINTIHTAIRELAKQVQELESYVYRPQVTEEDYDTEIVLY